MDEQLEEWKDIKGFEGYYQISSLGKVRGVERLREVCSAKGKKFNYVIKSKELNTYPTKRGRVRVYLSKGAKRSCHWLDSLMAEAEFFDTPITSSLDRDRRLIDALKSYIVNPNCVPVELVKQLKRVREAINAVRKPVFVDDTGKAIDYTH
jgi:hypothetical protein